MTTLVTGATGLVGANLVRLLAEGGARPRVLVREGADRRALLGVACDEVPGGVTDAAAVAAAMAGVSEVYHAAELVRFAPASRPPLQRVNVEGTRAVVDAARRAGVRRLVHVSSVAAVGYGPLEAPATEDSPYNFPGDNPYHQSRRQAEQLALAAATPRFEVVVANPGLVVGAGDARAPASQLLLALARGQLPFCPPGGLSVVAARDVADGLVRLMERGAPGERYILGGQPLPWRDFFALCAEEAGVAPPRLPLPEVLARGLGQAGDVLGLVAPALFRHLNTATLRALWLPAYQSSAKAGRALGWAAGPVRRGVREAYRWFQQEGFLPRERALTPRGEAA